MQEITLKVPDNKLGFFLELIEHLGFEVYDEKEVSEEHKNVVRERIKSAKPKDIVSWEKARKQFIFKDKS